MFKKRMHKAKAAAPTLEAEDETTRAEVDADATAPAPVEDDDDASSSDDDGASSDGDGPAAAAPVLHFRALGVAPWLVQACEALGLKRPSTIQRLAIPPTLRGRNVLGLAETGSGKTAAFALPILHRLFEDPFGVFSLMLTPSRELAQQIAQFLRILGEAQKIRVMCSIGGEDVVRQQLELQNERPHVVVGTPGRVVECLEGGLQDMVRHLKVLVLDEADRLLANAKEDVKVIFAALKQPQVLLYSATATNQLETFASALNTVKVEGSRSSVPTTLTQEYVFCPRRIKLAHLAQILLSFDLSERRDADRGSPADKEWRPRSALVFAQTCRRVHEVHSILQHQGIKAYALHSKMPQSERTVALDAFQQRHSQILVCTDVASRGLDLPAIDLVVNFDVPRDPDDYVHRVGRCARAGRAGLALSLITQSDLAYLAAIEGCLGARLAKCARFTERSLPLQPVARAMEQMTSLKRDRPG